MKSENSIMTANRTNKAISLTCSNCEKLSEIEGEKICFEQGQITRLTEDANPNSMIKMVCHSWSKNR
ncbi:hypothetical protein Q4601_14550 [Shewanella sp. 1_MG-2023]|uniref:Uncharacterized protein n=1 Tax=Shewanella electrodiphila TaxID=934143 RepID=A0ABT0KNY3_9GAMM|nr:MULTISPECIES: hypothetical protein [Shewanella]MCC4832560.1 hypothetical protein [Shewanella sp. 10N.7]MCL1045458.1 hypothetical protein [Shewanella electrodiphila]MDO6611429.1 hypothetical protein [Shewanella sp. 7_MG-2023]MDO6771284.1 hypothetical protein [Shewanella sp. 2_MG-2023]MDO6795525.1 hypothetical protein [Shewanella sp. 1_MG-2023]